MGSALLLRFLLGFLFGFLLFLLFAFRFYGYSFGIYLLHIREVSGDISFTVRCIDLIPAVFFLDDIQLFSLTNQGNNIRLRIGCGTYSKRCRCNSRLLLADIVSDFLCLAAFGYIIFLDVSGNIAGLDLDPAVCIGFRKNLADGIRVKSEAFCCELAVSAELFAEDAVLLCEAASVLSEEASSDACAAFALSSVFAELPDVVLPEEAVSEAVSSSFIEGAAAAAAIASLSVTSPFIPLSVEVSAWEAVFVSSCVSEDAVSVFSMAVSVLEAVILTAVSIEAPTGFKTSCAVMPDASAEVLPDALTRSRASTFVLTSLSETFFAERA